VKIKLILLITILSLSSIIISFASDNIPKYEVNSFEIEKIHNEHIKYERIVEEADELHNKIERHIDLNLFDIKNTPNINQLDPHNFMEINDNVFPEYLEHHTCGYGGTTCRVCVIDSHTGWCGCVLKVYKCCCGTILGGKEIYCSQHP